MEFNSLHGATTLSLCFANHFEVCHWYQSPSGWYQRIASFIPVRVVLSTDDMEKVSLVKGKAVRFAGRWFIVVERFDNLQYF